jgi:hypothetical protein
VLCVRASSPEVSSFYTRAFRTGDNSHILNFDFFDDEQLVIVLQVNDGDSGPGEFGIDRRDIVERTVLTKREQVHYTSLRLG